MNIVQALTARLKEAPLALKSTGRLNMRFSPEAMYDLLCELDPSYFEARRTGKRTFAIYNKKSGMAFRFTLDKRLPGKSFVLKVKK